jgi:hypothetical protein
MNPKILNFINTITNEIWLQLETSILMLDQEAANNNELSDEFENLKKTKILPIVADISSKVEEKVAKLSETLENIEEVIKQSHDFLKEEVKNLQPTIDLLLSDFRQIIHHKRLKKCQEKIEKQKADKEELEKKQKQIDEIMSRDEDFEDMGKIRIEEFATKSKSLSLVMFRNEKFYRSALKMDLNLLNFHIKEDDIGKIIDFLKQEMYFLTGEDPSEIHMGHEHSKITGKCYYQVCIFFRATINKKIKPFLEFFSGVPTSINYEFYSLATVFPNAARTYVRNKIPLESWKQELKGYNAIHGGMTVEEMKDIVKKTNMRDILCYGNNIEKNFLAHIQEKETPPFEWKWPDHLNKQPFDTEPFVQSIREWFEENCIENPMRKKALFLYSKERGMGKTFFSKNLVSNEEFYIYDRHTFNADSYKNKPNAKLIIADDIDYNKKEKQMWKALVAGEEYNVRTPYNNYKFNNGLSAIICSNNIIHLSSWIKDTDFMTQVVFVDVSKYMGPVGTRPLKLSVSKITLSEETKKDIEKVDQKYKQKLNAFDFLGKKRQKS